jgi:hypothetical protein
MKTHIFLRIGSYVKVTDNEKNMSMFAKVVAIWVDNETPFYIFEWSPERFLIKDSVTIEFANEYEQSYFIPTAHG